MEDEDPEQVVLMLAGVPRELEATLDAHELSEVNVSARDRPGTSWRDGGEMERLARWWRYWYGVPMDWREAAEGLGEF